MSYAPSPEAVSTIRAVILRIVPKLDPEGIADLMQLVGLMERTEPYTFCEEPLLDHPEDLEEAGLPPMSPRQRQVADLMHRYLHENGHYPNLEWLANALGVRRQTVIAILKVLETKGYVRHGGRGAWILTGAGRVPFEKATNRRARGAGSSRGRSETPVMRRDLSPGPAHRVAPRSQPDVRPSVSGSES